MYLNSQGIENIRSDGHALFNSIGFRVNFVDLSSFEGLNYYCILDFDDSARVNCSPERNGISMFPSASRNVWRFKSSISQQIVFFITFCRDWGAFANHIYNHITIINSENYIVRGNFKVKSRVDIAE